MGSSNLHSLSEVFSRLRQSSAASCSTSPPVPSYKHSALAFAVYGGFGPSYSRGCGCAVILSLVVMAVILGSVAVVLAVVLVVVTLALGVVCQGEATLATVVSPDFVLIVMGPIIRWNIVMISMAFLRLIRLLFLRMLDSLPNLKLIVGWLS